MPVWRGTMEELKSHVIWATIQSEALHLEVRPSKLYFAIFKILQELYLVVLMA